MSRATVTPLEALKRLIEACKLVDFKDCPDLYNQFQTELAVAEMVVRDYDLLSAFQAYEDAQPADPDDMAANYDHSTHDKRMEVLRAKRDEQAAPDTCRVDDFSSRGCELGTKGCIIHHAAPSVVAAPKGYTLVPNSPNEEMLRPDGFSYRLGYDQYQAMLAAAPAIKEKDKA